MPLHGEAEAEAPETLLALREDGTLTEERGVSARREAELAVAAIERKRKRRRVEWALVIFGLSLWYWWTGETATWWILTGGVLLWAGLYYWLRARRARDRALDRASE